MANALAATALYKSFGTVNAVQGISIQLPHGKCLAILGPNGAGKTTLVEMLEGLQEPDQGDIEVLGKTYETSQKQIYENIGVLLQETHLYKKFTVLETLSLFASFFAKKINLERLISELGLSDKTNARLESLSGGQKQRVYLGCALVNDPQVLFLDEPTTGLDPQARRHIWSMLESLKAQGKSILLTTHYLDEAEQLADEVVIIDHGKIIAHGTPSALIKNTCGEQKLSFEFSNKTDAQTIQSLLASKGAHLTENNTVEISTADALKDIAAVTQHCERSHIALGSLQMRENTLEDVFIKLTGRKLREA